MSPFFVRVRVTCGLGIWMSVDVKNDLQQAIDAMNCREHFDGFEYAVFDFTGGIVIGPHKADHWSKGDK